MDNEELDLRVTSFNLSSSIIPTLLSIIYVGEIYTFLRYPSLEEGLLMVILTFLFLPPLRIFGRDIIRNKLIFKKNRIEFISAFRFFSPVFLYYEDIEKIWVKGIFLRIKSEKFNMSGVYFFFRNKQKIKSMLKNKR